PKLFSARSQVLADISPRDECEGFISRRFSSLPQRQDSVNQLNPAFCSRGKFSWPSSKAQHNTCRDPYIVLRRTEETCLHIVSLKAPCERTNDFVVQAATDGGGKRSIGSGVAGVYVRSSEQTLHERTKFAY